MKPFASHPFPRLCGYLNTARQSELQQLHYMQKKKSPSSLHTTSLTARGWGSHVIPATSICHCPGTDSPASLGQSFDSFIPSSHTSTDPPLGARDHTVPNLTAGALRLSCLGSWQTLPSQKEPECRLSDQSRQAQGTKEMDKIFVHQKAKDNTE